MNGSQKCLLLPGRVEGGDKLPAVTWGLLLFAMSWVTDEESQGRRSREGGQLERILDLVVVVLDYATKR